MIEFAAIDFETTGYENGATNEPWQLGVAIVRDGVIVCTDEFFFKTSQLPASSTSTSYFDSLLNSSTSQLSILDQWSSWYPLLEGRRLVAHNIATERTILTRLAPLTKWGPWVDTLKLAKARYPKLPSYALGDLCETFGLVPQMEGRTWHDGLYDAVACANLANFLNAI